MATPSEFEKIASACIHHYEKRLQKKGKPNEKEWTLLSAIILWRNGIYLIVILFLLNHIAMLINLM